MRDQRNVRGGHRIVAQLVGAHPSQLLALARHREAFIDELVRYHGAPRALAAELLAREDAWSAGDLYFACALGQVSGRPCRTVVTLRERAPAQPWSEIAGQVGAAPGTAPFQRLRTEIAASYRRWARPLPDAD